MNEAGPAGADRAAVDREARRLALRFRLTMALRASSVFVAGLATLAVLSSATGWNDVLSQGMFLVLAAAGAQGAGWLIGGLYAPLWTGLFAPLPPEGQTPSPTRGASWAGAVTGAALASLLAAVVLPRLGGPPAGTVLLAFALATHFAYLPAKLACLVQGCCKAIGGPIRRFPGNLPGLEIALTLGVLAMSLWLAAAHPSLAAPVAMGGHLAIRALAADQRGRGPGVGWPLSDPGFEVFALSAVALATMLIG